MSRRNLFAAAPAAVLPAGALSLGSRARWVLPGLLLASLPLLVFLLAVGFAAALRPGAPPPSACALGARWVAQEAALHDRLRADPRDDQAALALSSRLLCDALVEGRQGAPAGAEGGLLDGDGDRQQLAAALPAYPAFLEARRLAQAGAKGSRDPGWRARGWVRLAQLHYYLDDLPGRLACPEAAAGEDPSWRGSLERLQEYERRIAAEGGAGEAFEFEDEDDDDLWVTPGSPSPRSPPRPSAGSRGRRSGR